MATPVCGTDYAPECGALPMTFFQMLANCLINTTICNLQGDPRTFINTTFVTYYCDDITSFWDCDNNAQMLDPERALVENAFALDECGHLSIKIFANLGEA
jgi:hypothetical protein